MRVRFLELSQQLKDIQDQINRSFARVLASGSFSIGEEVPRFEEQLSRYCKAKYCVAVNSGTSALHLALLAHGIKAGDEVITQPNTFIATCEAISYVGAKPVFVDIDAVSHGMDLARIERVITKKTKAILPV